MEKLKFVGLEGTATENLPLSLQNLEVLQRLYLNRCKMLENNALSNIIQMLSNFFPFLKTVRLQDSNLTILSACIEECRFLELLDLCYCKKLREIIGLPPRIGDFLAYNCKLPEAHSSTLNNLLRKAIEYTTRKFYVLPGERIPEWFNNSSEGSSLCFWFLKEFPSTTVWSILGDGENMERPFFLNLNFLLKSMILKYLFCLISITTWILTICLCSITLHIQ
ncbi:hypothetical protein GLYMA_16G211032v4 [Glycine max]|nr:hypothetical protein GLYMA_16G211032v4 [Glycine max]KAH1152263.1 hypothetical protein GYH30_045656 [Glycine max]